MVAVHEGDRLPPGGPVVGQVPVGYDAATPLHLAHDEIRRLPGIESVRALVLDPAQCSRQVRLPEGIPQDGGLTLPREELGGGGREGREGLHHVGTEGVEESGPDREAVGQAYGGRQELGPRKGPVALVGLPHPADRAGHRHRQVTHHGSVGQIARLVQEHVPGGCCRCPLPEVEGRGGAACFPKDEKPSASDVARFGVHHRQRELNRDGGVHGGTPGSENVDSNPAGQLVRGHHHPAVRLDRSDVP